MSFSKLELILPVVPLGVESIGTFDVINEGFEAISLKHRFDIVDSSGNFLISEGNLHADANRPEITVIFP